MANSANGFNAHVDIVIVFDAKSNQVMGVVKTNNKEIALEVLANYLESEDTAEVLDWLKENTRLEIIKILDPNTPLL